MDTNPFNDPALPPKYDTLNRDSFSIPVKKLDDIEDEDKAPFYISTRQSEPEPITTEWLTVSMDQDEVPSTQTNNDTIIKHAN